MHKPFLSLILLVLSVQLSYTQNDFIPTHSQSRSLSELEAHFNQWADQQDLKQAKGWKWYQRWLEFQIQRQDPHGKLPNSHAFFEESLRISQLKLRQDESQTRSGAWSPIGPVDIPPSPNPGSLHGMGRINCLAFHPTDTNTIWVGVSQGGVWKTTNHGQSWIPLTDDLPILRISDIAVDPNNTDVIYISVGDYAYLSVGLDLDGRWRNTHYGLGVYKTTDGGQSWQATGLSFEQTQEDGSLTRRVLIDPANSDHLLAAGIHGIWTSQDGGDQWTQVMDTMIWDLEQDFGDPHTIYASTAYIANFDKGRAGIMKSTDFGQSWISLPTGIPAEDTVQRVEIALSPSNPQYIYALTCNMVRGFYGLYRSTDGGQNWTLQSHESDGVNILHWYDGLNASGGQGTYDLAIMVDPQDENKIYTGGVNIWGSEDGGQNWSPVSLWYGAYGPSAHADQHFFKHNPLDDLFYVCNDGGIIRTHDIRLGSWDSAFSEPNYLWPTVWENISDGLQITAFYRVGISLNNPGYLIAGAQDNSTFFYNTLNWLNIIGGDGMDCLIHPDDPLTIYGSSQFGNLVRSYDGGYDLDYGLANQIRQGAGERGAWTTPMWLDPTDPLRLYAGFGNLWLSEDEGDSWTSLSALANMAGAPYPSPASAIGIAPSNDSMLYMTKRINHEFNEPSRFWRSLNAGATWQERTAGLPDSLFFQDLVVDTEDPLHVYVAIGGFIAGQKVFESWDGGDNWSNLSGNLPNLPVNALAFETGSDQHTLYAGTDIGVWYRTDSLAEWQFYSQELPNVIVTDLEVDTIQGKLIASTFGRGLWMADLANGETVSSIETDWRSRWNLNLRPNPNNGQFALSLEIDHPTEVRLEIIDVMGRQVLAETLQLSAYYWEKNYHLPLSSGLYYVRIHRGKESLVKKFLVD